MRIKFFSTNEFRRGYVALISVILISAIGVAVMISVIASGVDASKTDLALQQSGSARSMASSCAEEALQTIVETRATSSSGNLTIGSGTCAYSYQTEINQTITVQATGVLGSATSKIKVVISTTTPGITLSSWEQVADF